MRSRYDTSEIAMAILMLYDLTSVFTFGRNASGRLIFLLSAASERATHAHVNNFPLDVPSPTNLADSSW